MRKEYLVAIVLGILVGVLVAFGAWRVNKALKTKKQNSPPVTNTISPISPTLAPQEAKIALIGPQENDVITTTPVKFSGLTSPNSLVVISGEEKDLIFKSDSNGEFKSEVPLIGGINQVLVLSFDEVDNKNELARTVVLSREFAKELENIKSENTTKSSTDEAGTIRDVVRKKIEDARKNPKAYSGTITDKTQESLQLKNLKGEIKLLSISPETSFIKVLKNTTNITFNDVAIGDFIVAMGFVIPNGSSKENSNEVLDARRILVTEPTPQIKRTAIKGTVTSIVKKEVTLTATDQKQWKLEFPKKWVGPEISELSQDDVLIAAGEAKDSTLSIRTIYLVPNAQPSPTTP